MSIIWRRITTTYFNGAGGVVLKRCLSSTSERFTLRTEENGIREIRMNDPKTRNTLSLRMMENLIEDIGDNNSDPSLRCIVISSKAPVFSAGHNFKELAGEKGRDNHLKVFNTAGQLMKAIEESSVPVIAKVDGLAAAAGLQLVSHCDIVVASNSSQFSVPGSSFGLFCSTPGIGLSRVVPKRVALYMLLTGQPIQAREAMEFGLVSKIVPSEALDAEVNAVCNAIIAKSRSVVELGKKFFYEQIEMNLKDAYSTGAMKMVENLELVDGQEGIKSFIEKRKPKWTHQ